MKYFIFGFILLITCFFAPSGFAGEWIPDAKNGCQVWNDNPRLGDSISWSGPCSNKLANGNGVVQWYSNGVTSGRYEGQYMEGLQNGNGVYIFETGSSYTGEWKDGKYHGKGKYISKSGSIVEGDWVGGQFTGEGTILWPNGTKSIGTYKNLSLNGYGVRTLKNGARYEGEWKEDKYHGKGKYLDSKGNLFEGIWVNGDMIGNGDVTLTTGEKLVNIRLEVKYKFDDKLGIFSDTRSGLIWSRCSVGRKWNENEKICTGDWIKASWGEMVALVNKENYAGFADWRLPTVFEYKALISTESIKSCDRQKSVVNNLFPNVYSSIMFGSNHWLADNGGDLMTPSSADLEVTSGMLGCKVTENSLKTHSNQPAIMVRGGSVSQEWIFALSKLNLVKEINAKAAVEHSKYWNGVGKSIRDFAVAAAGASQSGGNSPVGNSSLSKPDKAVAKIEEAGADQWWVTCTNGKEQKIHFYKDSGTFVTRLGMGSSRGRKTLNEAATDFCKFDS